MLRELFYWLFNMSIIATVMGSAAAVIRQIRIIPRRMAVYLWLVPFIRMSVPWGWNQPYSLMTLISRFTAKTITVYQFKNDVSFSMTNFVMSASKYFPISFRSFLLHMVFTIASMVWLSGIVVLLWVLWRTYKFSWKQVQNAKHLKGNVYESDQVEVAAVYGIFQPKIILPIGLSETDYDYVVQHEQTHIDRKDNLWRLFACLITLVHWFNPFAWWFLKLFLEDLEHACDEAMLAKLTEPQRKEYAHSLLNSIERNTLITSGFGGASIHNRIQNILSYRQLSIISIITFLILLFSVFAVLLTNAG